MTDPLTAAICADLQRRAAKGEAEYGVTVHGARLTLGEWLNHQYEELLDGAVYAKKAMAELEAQRPPMTATEAAALQALLAWLDGWDRLPAGNPSGASQLHELQQHLRLMAAAVRKERTP